MRRSPGSISNSPTTSTTGSTVVRVVPSGRWTLRLAICRSATPIIPMERSPM